MSTNVCDNPEKFNKAYKEAVDNYSIIGWNNLSSCNKVVINLMLVVYLLLTVLAVILAMRSDPQSRVINVFFAFVAGPLYVISYYLSNMNRN
jgi:hypothetical protein